jgi:peptidoglycan/LPS O-acetylase OafA/YrhL
VSVSATERTGTIPHNLAPPSVKHRLEVLDGIRFLAAAYVVVFHFSAGDRGSWHGPSRMLFAPLFSIASYGWLGVELFFMISGFVICLSAWGKTMGQFAISRFVRLYPAYWFAILLTTIVLLVDQSRAHALSWSQLLENLTMTESYAQVPAVDPSYWTLAIELNFYLLVAVTLVWRGFTYRRVVTFCTVWLAVSLLDSFTDSYWYGLAVQPLYVPFFVGGVVLYLMHRFRPSLTLWTLLVSCWACAMYRLIDRTAVQHPSGVNLNYWVSATIVTVFFVLLTLIALHKLTAIRGRWLVTAGALTYPLYLLHQQIGETVIRSLDHRLPSWLLLVGVFALMLALSWLVQHYAERPLARRLRTILIAGLNRAGDLRRRVVGPKRKTIEADDTTEPIETDETAGCEAGSNPASIPSPRTSRTNVPPDPRTPDNAIRRETPASLRSPGPVPEPRPDPRPRDRDAPVADGSDPANAVAESR